ncbi:MAG: triosephosphate isomerase [Candidatus Yanofskybacteria bacterium]|nr:triosephosphate isomerase [Candidatus Yanofskybacteria bacterium]
MNIIIANWKANPTTLDEAMELFDFYLAEISKYQNIQLIICPPFVFLEELSKKLKARNQKSEAISLGAQDIFWEKSGPYTGETSTDMLKNFSVTHALIGHSDRRYKIGETDEVINKKIKAAFEAGIVPVLLVGEQNHGDDRKQILEAQLDADLAGLTAEQISKVLIAYEPVWAISTVLGAQPDTPESSLEAMRIIDNFLTNTRNLTPEAYLYGGSVNANNVADFLQHPKISGAVIGGASLRKDEFGKILKIVSNL